MKFSIPLSTLHCHRQQSRGQEGGGGRRAVAPPKIWRGLPPTLQCPPCFKTRLFKIIFILCTISGVVRVGEVDGEFVINPTWSELSTSKLNLVIACSERKVG